MKTPAVLFFILLSCLAKAQILYRHTSSPQNNAVCPKTEITYRINQADPRCDYGWTTNNNIDGRINYPLTDRTAAIIKWKDIPGGEAKAEVTQVQKRGQRACPYAGQKLTITESIMSVAGETIPVVNTTRSIDYCDVASKTVIVTIHYIKSKNSPWEWQAEYQWEIPSGWRDDAGHNGVSAVTTAYNQINITPQRCSETAILRVSAKVPGCANAGLSNPASITLNVTNKPAMSVVAPQGAKLTTCGTSNITLVANVNPYALPCARGVSWTTPAGWTKVNQSGNSVTFRPSGADRNPVTINALASFACGSSVGNSITIPYAAPEIIGSNIVCNTSTFSVSNVEPPASVQWSSSNPSALSITSAGIVARNNSYNGSVTITVAFNCNTPPLRKDIWVGASAAEIRHAFGQSDCRNGEAFFGVSTYGSIATNWSWVPHVRGLRFLLGSNNQQTAYGIMTAREVPLILYYRDACGQARVTHIRLVNPCLAASAWHMESQMAGITAFPNPATTELTIEVNEGEVNVNEEFEEFRKTDRIPVIRKGVKGLKSLKELEEGSKLSEKITIILLGKQGQVYYKISTNELTVKIPVADLPRGICFLRIGYQGKIENKQIILE